MGLWCGWTDGSWFCFGLAKTEVLLYTGVTVTGSEIVWASIVQFSEHSLYLACGWWKDTHRQRRSSFCANGSLSLPLICSLTLEGLSYQQQNISTWVERRYFSSYCFQNGGGVKQLLQWVPLPCYWGWHYSLWVWGEENVFFHLLTRPCSHMLFYQSFLLHHYKFLACMVQLWFVC